MDYAEIEQRDQLKWHCRSCSKAFATRGIRDAHHRREHQRVLITEASGVQRQVERTVDGKFECICGKVYSRGQGLNRHQSKCGGVIDALESEAVEDGIELGMAMEAKLLIVDEANTEGMEAEDCQNLPIDIDNYYNVLVCKECGIGIPFEWVSAHLNDQHGVKLTEEDVMRVLNLDNEPMTVDAAKDWIKTVWIGRAIQGIPVMDGVKCTECEYSAAKMKVMVNHFVKDHKGLKASENTRECKVQMVFQSTLHKYIQVTGPEGLEVLEEIDYVQHPDWVKAVNWEFAESMANTKVGLGRKADLRLKNVFIAKMRWDIFVEDMDLEKIVKMTAMPISNDPLHKIVLCGRRYIHEVCKQLDKGSIIVKRLLMSKG
jgi:hypothetical protein